MTSDSDSTMRPACIHLGSKRRCCGELYICRESPDAHCILVGLPMLSIRSCETCEYYKPATWLRQITAGNEQ